VPSEYLDMLYRQARKKFLKLTQEQEKEIIKAYIQAGNDLLDRYNKTKNNTALKSYLYEYKNALHEQILKLTKDGAYSSAEIAATVEADVLKNIAEHGNWHGVDFKSMFLNVPDDVVKRIVSGNIYKDGKGLSERVWSVANRNGRDIQNVINTGMINKRSATDIAKALEGYINPDERKTWDRAKIKDTLGPGYAGQFNNLEYNALRTARTTCTHSYELGVIEGSKRNPFIEGIKWNLSQSHYSRMHGRTDSCDDYATQNSYGLGEGVFPIEEVPFDHPNGLCYQTSYISKPISQCSDELKAWVNGADNAELDNWYKEYGLLGD
jgi:hypothetical protein